MNKYMW